MSLASQTRTNAYDLDQQWQGQSRLVSEMDACGIQQFFLTRATAGQTFVRQPPDQPRSLACMDEGINVPSCLKLAGTGILVPQRTFDRYLAQHNLGEIITHDDCAGGRERYGVRNADQHVQQWAAEVVRKRGITHRHLSSQELDRDEGTHPGIAVYFDGTGTYHNTPAFPLGFIVSRPGMPTSSKDVKLAVLAALGPAGYGDRFTPQNPFRVIILGHPTDPGLSADRLKTEVEDEFGSSARFREKATNRIRVETVDTAGLV